MVTVTSNKKEIVIYVWGQKEGTNLVEYSKIYSDQS